MPTIKRLRLLVRQVEQPFRAQFLVLVAHHVGDAQCRCAWAFRIRKHVQLRHVEVVEERVGLLEALRRLTPTTHHHVHADKRIGHQRLDTVDLVGKQLGVVVPVHQLQHRVAAALQGNVEMRHKRPALRTEGDQLVRKQVGLQRTDPVAADALHSVECLHQVDEPFTRGLAEIADVHTRQHDLLASLPGSLLSLCHERGDGRIPREASGVWYRAVCAEIVAAVLHLQEIPRPIAPRTARRKALDILRLLNIIRCTLSRCGGFAIRHLPPGITQILHQLRFLVRA